MKLTMKIMLFPDFGQHESLKNTLQLCNDASNEISASCFEKKRWQKYLFQHSPRAYYPVKSSFKSSTLVLIRRIAKVTNGYQPDKKVKPAFKRWASI